MMRERYKNTAAAVITRHLGRNAVDVKHAAEETGISERKLYALREGSQQPNATDIGLLTELLGARFLQEMFAPAGISEVVADQPPLTNPHMVMQAKCEAMSALNEALADDGRVDHREWQVVAPKMRQANDLIRAWLSGGPFQRKQAAE